MSSIVPVIKAASSVLIHTPGLTRYGSKPHREISANPARLVDLNRNLRSFQQAQGYLPNQVFIGQQVPEKLSLVSRPWFGEHAMLTEERKAFGSIIDERLFLALIALADPFKHVALLDRFWEETAAPLQHSAVCRSLATTAPNLIGSTKLKTLIEQRDGLPLFAGNDSEPIGWIANGHHEDESLSATVLLENLCGKVSAALSLHEMFLGKPGLKKQDVDFVLGCSEEAVGDRYQRGGGNLAKAIAEFAGCDMASGFDIKDFCAAPIPAMVTAAALVQSGVAENIVFRCWKTCRLQLPSGSAVTTVKAPSSIWRASAAIRCRPALHWISSLNRWLSTR
jgi:betaine reductase